MLFDDFTERRTLCLITNKFVIKTNAFFAAIASVLVMKFKALEQLIFLWGRGPTTVRGWTTSLSLF